MSDDGHGAILEILRKLQADNADLRRLIAERFAQLEELILRQGRDSAGALMMMRATAGDFDKRVSEIKDRIDALDGSDWGPTGGLREP